VNFGCEDGSEFLGSGVVEAHQAKKLNVFVDEERHIKLKKILGSTMINISI
jgi:hypothetical protein